MVDSGSLKTLSVGDIAGDFFVPSYQRGYRWGQQEVSQLLDDLRESCGTTYYLQPLVVKGRDDGSWELVDGQQRLTTLYLIFSYLKNAHLPSVAINYSLTYETREGSRTTWIVWTSTTRTRTSISSTCSTPTSASKTGSPSSSIEARMWPLSCTTTSSTT